jgi:thiamine kinase-like enzyme
MDEVALRAAVAELSASVGLPANGLKIERCPGGGNNRVLRVEGSGKVLIAKCYFRQASDARNRLQSECSFLEYASLAEIDCVPRVVARDTDAGIVLFEFIDGSKLDASTLEETHVKQAQSFFVRLNEVAARSRGDLLPQASEACFCIADQLRLVERRIERLATIPRRDPIDDDAISFVNTLSKRWKNLRNGVSAEFDALRIDRLLPLPMQDRCVSPSDFGFHNAIVTRDNKVHFIDFEYAGWDDPAKAISDFFCHPAVPVSFKYFDAFVAEALHRFGNPSELATRTRLLLPVFAIKWCCIVMNDFLPSFERRRFADPEGDETRRKRAQLEKASRLLEALP